MRIPSFCFPRLFLIAMIQGIRVLPPATVYVHMRRNRSKDKVSSRTSRKFQGSGFLARQHVNVPHLAAPFFYLAEGYAPVCLLPYLLRLYRRADRLLLQKQEHPRCSLWKTVISGGFLPASLNVPPFPVGQGHSKVLCSTAVELAQRRPLCGKGIGRQAPVNPVLQVAFHIGPGLRQRPVFVLRPFLPVPSS